MTTDTTAMIGELAQEASERADEIEAAGRVPVDLFSRVKASGLLRLSLPAEHGGRLMPPADWFDVAVEVARADGSLGWLVASTLAFNPILAAAAPPSLVRSVFDDPNGYYSAGTNGAGTAVEVDGGYEVEGRWAFSSGIWDATWLGGLCLERMPDRPPRALLVSVPASRADRIRNWDVTGLRGTASDDVGLPRQIVPGEWTFALPVPRDATIPSHGRVRSYTQGLWPTAAAVAATQLGIARRALDEVIAFARDKRRPGERHALVSEQEFRRRVFRLESAWRAARKGVDHELRALWGEAGAADGVLGTATRIGVRLATTHAAWLGADVVRHCYDLAGASAVRRTHPLARCQRDGTILQHQAAASERMFDYLAPVALGDVDDDVRL